MSEERDDGAGGEPIAVLTNSELAASESSERAVIKGAKASRRGPSLDAAHSHALKKALTKDRHVSRSGKGRGLAKKGGGGGKGTWGKPGDELYATSLTTDKKDPNYDSDTQDDVKINTVDPEITEEQFKQYIDEYVHEYFENGDTMEVVESLKELNLGRFHDQIVRILINMALDRKATVRELSSVLISDMYGHIITFDDVAKSFIGLLNDLPDLTIDTPDAPNIVGQFMARCVADDCLPPKFLQGFKGTVDSEQATAALERADLLLNMKHGIVRLDNVWGVGGGIRPVKVLIKKMILLLKEFISSADVQEASRCLLELEVPHFNHELVYEGLLLVIEDGKQQTMDVMGKLFKALYEACYVTSDQMTQGFIRILDNMHDIQLDAPHAGTSFDSFAEICFNAGCLPNRVIKELPGRGRKRYVSEGDGGRVKDSNGTLNNK